MKMIKAFGNDLIFISEINKDGSGTIPVSNSEFPYLNKEKFNIFYLSMSEGTYIAHGFRSYVVRVKDLPELIKKNTPEYT